MYCTIYKITNIINNKVYIGQTWGEDLQKYFNKSHARDSRRVKLYSAITKYGPQNFVIKPILLVKTQEEADEQESLLILECNSIKEGYNLRSGGARGKHSEESKQKISRSLQGNKLSEKTKKKISDAHLGKKLSNQTKYKMSQAKIGKRVSPSTEFQKGHVQNRKFTNDEEQIIAAEYNGGKSSHLVARMFGCSNTTILNIARRQSNKFQLFPGNNTEFNTESVN